MIPITKPHIFNLTKNFRFLKDPKDGFHKKDTAWLVANKKTEKEVAEHIYNILLKMEMSTEWVAELQQMIKEKIIRRMSLREFGWQHILTRLNFGSLGNRKFS